MGAYSKIIKQAYEITVQNRFLWIFGLFLSASLLYFWSEHLLVRYFNMPPFLTVLIWLLVLMFFVRNIASLVVAVKAIQDKQQTSFRKAYLSSKLFYGRVLVGSVLSYFAIMILVWMLIGPGIYLYGKQLISQAFILLGIGSVILLPLLAGVIVVSIMVPLYVVIYDLKIKESFERSLDMLSKHWSPLFSLLVLLVILDLPALFLGQFMVGLRGGLVISILAGIVFLLFQSVFMVFQQIAWILMFTDLIKPQKIEDPEPVVAPEIAG